MGLKKALLKLVDLIMISRGTFLTYHKRPVKSSSITKGLNEYSSDNIAIVLQGPVIKRYDFTLETIKLYIKRYPKAYIILSTWVDDWEIINKKFDSKQTYVCLSEKPEISGRGNINMQRISTLAGIKKAKELGCQYVLKTRTDQRIYGENVLALFIKLIQMFPISKKLFPNTRLITTNLCTFKNRLYNICDMLMFGYIDDVYNYYNAPEVENLPKGYEYDESDVIGYAKARPGEIHFTISYLERCGHNIKWTIEDSNEIRYNYFVIIDNEIIELYWPKYDYKEFKFKSYDKDYSLIKSSFSEWLINQK